MGTSCRRLLFLFIVVGIVLLSFRHGTLLGQYLIVSEDEANVEGCNEGDNNVRLRWPDRVLPKVAAQFSFNSTLQHEIITANLPTTNNTSKKPTTYMYYCVITKDSMWPGVNFSIQRWGWTRSVPHSAEAILACWSWFQRIGATPKTRVLLISDGLPVTMHKWSLHLVRAMGCRIYSSNGLNNLKSLLLLKRKKHAVYYEPRFAENHWIDSRADADSLRELLLPGFERDTTQIHVGILERETNRRIRNVTELEQRLVEHFNVSIQRMDDLPFQQQAAWFASQHVIVAAHGAALTNSIFLLPNTTIIQLYPFEYYLPGYFESLISKVGGNNLDWYPGDKAIAPDVHKKMKPGDRKRRKDAPYIDTNITEIVNLVLEAVKVFIQR